jgi:hypothetical protein
MDADQKNKDQRFLRPQRPTLILKSKARSKAALLELRWGQMRLGGKGVRMNTIRWVFFLMLSILLIASCNSATAEFHVEPAQVSMVEPAPQA